MTIYPFREDVCMYCGHHRIKHHKAMIMTRIYGNREGIACYHPRCLCKWQNTKYLEIIGVEL